jgi:hypothetical protein
MALIDAKVHSAHVQVIRSDTGTETGEKCRDIQNKPISRKKLRVFP